MGNWISMKERKPRLLETVRVKELDGKEYDARFDRTGIWFDQDTGNPIDPIRWLSTEPVPS